jgi:hypothetical protein
MWIRVLVVTVLAFLIGYAVRDFIRANPGVFGTGGLFGKKDARKRAGAGPRGVSPAAGPLEPSGKVLSFRRRPHAVLGVGEDASLDEAQAAWSRQKDENDPGKLAGMSDDLRSLAEVRCTELDQAWQAFQDERA